MNCCRYHATLMVVNEAVEWDFDRAKDTYHRWRTANPHRPFKVYHLKLIFYLLLQLIEWPADVILAVWLFKADHHNTGRATAVMTVAPQLVIAFFIVLNMETFKSARTWQKPFILLGLLPVRFLAYLVMDVLITLYVFFVELVYFCIGFLPHLGPSKNRFARMPDQRRRQFIFFRGIYEFWFESLPQFVIRLVFSTCNVLLCTIAHGIFDAHVCSRSKYGCVLSEFRQFLLVSSLIHVLKEYSHAYA